MGNAPLGKSLKIIRVGAANHHLLNTLISKRLYRIKTESLSAALTAAGNNMHNFHYHLSLNIIPLCLSARADTDIQATIIYCYHKNEAKMTVIKSYYFLSLALLLVFYAAAATAQNESNNTEAVNFAADTITSDAAAGILTATGNVTLEQGRLKLTADRVDYTRKTGTATALGNVTFQDQSGNKHYAEFIELESEFSRAFAEPVISQLADKAWIGSDSITHEKDKNTVFQGARYTPCDCDFIGGETPVWEINTSSTEHNAQTKIIEHHNVVMKAYGVPIFYLPYLSQPDWTIDRHSGLLSPTISFSSDSGTNYAQPYYWVTGETHDIQFTSHILGNKGFALQTDFRQRWDNSKLNARIIGGHLNTYKENRQNVAAIDAEFVTKLGTDWNMAMRLYRASQDTFMRRYGFDDAEILKSSFLAEQLGDNRYSRIEAYDIQDLTSTSDPEKEPRVLPSVFHERYIETPYDGLDLRLRLSALRLNDDDATDLTRWTSELYARNNRKTSIGLFGGVIGFEGRMGLQYRNIKTPTNGTTYTGELASASVSVGMEWQRPIAVRLAERVAIIEPKIKLVSTRATDKSAEIPNRDSADFHLDEANLFLLHRVQGEDYNITNTRVDGGVSLSLYDPYLGDVSGFVGSSYRLSGTTPIGLNAAAEDDRQSDILASVSIKPNPKTKLAASGRFHPRNLSLNEANLNATAEFDKTKIAISYQQLSNSFFDSADEEIEEIAIDFQQDLGQGWLAKIQHTHDLSDNTDDVSSSSLQLDYNGGFQDCLNISIGYTRDNDNDRDIQPIDKIYVLFKFKYLGSVKSDGFGGG